MRVLLAVYLSHGLLVTVAQHFECEHVGSPRPRLWLQGVQVPQPRCSGQRRRRCVLRRRRRLCRQPLPQRQWRWQWRLWRRQLRRWLRRRRRRWPQGSMLQGAAGGRCRVLLPCTPLAQQPACSVLVAACGISVPCSHIPRASVCVLQCGEEGHFRCGDRQQCGC